MLSPSLPLPVHGFVLAGGKSSRMGRDKALLPFRGRPMVEIAVEKLRAFCAEVSIAGNREELAAFASVVREDWLEAGPAAGIHAGLRHAAQAWTLFTPVDVPLLPSELLQRWSAEVLARAGCRVSYLRAAGQRQPALCMVHRDCCDDVRVALEAGVLKLAAIFERAEQRLGPGTLWVAEAERFSPGDAATEAQMARWFCNVNTPAELAEAEAWEPAR